MSIILPRGQLVQVIARPTVNVSRRLATSAQSAAIAFASQGGNIIFGTVPIENLPIYGMNPATYDVLTTQRQQYARAELFRY